MGAKINIWNYIEKITPFLQYGMPLPKACLHAGVPFQTVYAYMSSDEEVKSAVAKLMDQANVLARKAWVGKFSDDWKAARDWLERKEPEEFGKKDSSLPQGIVNVQYISFNSYANEQPKLDTIQKFKQDDQGKPVTS